MKTISTLLFITSMLFLVGCEEELGPELCESQDTGTLTLENTRSTTITVTVSGFTKTISSGNTATFNNVPSGTCKCDVTYNGTKYTNVQFGVCVTQCSTTALQY